MGNISISGLCNYTSLFSPWKWRCKNWSKMFVGETSHISHQLVIIGKASLISFTKCTILLCIWLRIDWSHQQVRNIHLKGHHKYHWYKLETIMELGLNLWELLHYWAQNNIHYAPVSVMQWRRGSMGRPWRFWHRKQMYQNPHYGWRLDVIMLYIPKVPHLLLLQNSISEFPLANITQ